MQPDAPLRVTDRAGADALVGAVMTAMQSLEAVLAAESAHVRVGRLREGLAASETKAALAGAYLRGLEAAKANAVALARFAPTGVEALKAAHRRFTAAVETNQTVLATARTVSEGLIKSLAADLGRARTPTVYGAPSRSPSPYGRGAPSAPLVLSRNL